ncbi:MAG TPA: pyridoxamine 5'-phosphate oxidase family protein [Henriciella marina]|uniref:pyridoxamine 5'-phosphate oxidase family protein n=1 Tax=Henriciella sp. TaxID=1968823 RepID=UPI0017C31FDB|nr:pyridoxamine 5'-phosphate oxidase family protein [Henriciella sp.]HIG23760.1 pyridoxamine 5'-phosphate oxidase family protein [Henriciella sp.]HIK66240.1 pyridoxamine 5'-phosphate oxidase family protein [Henriciella marina]
MGKTYEKLDDKLIAFIKAQKMFFVATAPLSGEGHVNVSPKGYDSFIVIDENTVAYADLGGSGIETLAHVNQNARITIMFCAFEGPANIVRIYGKGRTLQFNHPDFETDIRRFPPGHERARNIIYVDISSVSDSCGWGVPFYEFKGQRDQLQRYIENKPVEEWHESRLAKNAESIDGLPGMTRKTEKAS